MQKISTLDLIPGMVIAENVLSYDRQVILAKGTVLTDSFITRLELHGILVAYIEDPAENELLAGPEPAPESDKPRAPLYPTYSQRIKASPRFKEFKRSYEMSTENFKNSINEMVAKNVKVDPTQLLVSPLDMVSKAGSLVDVLDMLQNMREYDDSTFAHSMNVALLNYVAAGWLRWSPEEQRMAMACGLFHDIGKLQVDHDILNKPGKLDDQEYEHIKKHTIFGYKLLLEQDVDDHIRYAALMHHERYDGTGYPLHVVGDQIDQFARLTAISDVYDAMTAARVYRGPMCPFRVIEIFEEEGFAKYDSEFILSFLANVGNTYIRNACRLNDGREGEIIMINQDKLSRPVVMVGTEYINLKDHPDLYIDELI